MTIVISWTGASREWNRPDARRTDALAALAATVTAAELDAQRGVNTGIRTVLEAEGLDPGQRGPEVAGAAPEGGARNRRYHGSVGSAWDRSSR